MVFNIMGLRMWDLILLTYACDFKFHPMQEAVMLVDIGTIFVQVWNRVRTKTEINGIFLNDFFSHIEMKTNVDWLISL